MPNEARKRRFMIWSDAAHSGGFYRHREGVGPSLSTEPRFGQAYGTEERAWQEIEGRDLRAVFGKVQVAVEIFKGEEWTPYHMALLRREASASSYSDGSQFYLFERPSESGRRPSGHKKFVIRNGEGLYLRIGAQFGGHLVPNVDRATKYPSVSAAELDLRAWNDAGYLGLLGVYVAEVGSDGRLVVRQATGSDRGLGGLLDDQPVPLSVADTCNSGGKAEAPAPARKISVDVSAEINPEFLRLIGMADDILLRSVPCFTLPYLKPTAVGDETVIPSVSVFKDVAGVWRVIANGDLAGMSMLEGRAHLIDILRQLGRPEFQGLTVRFTDKADKADKTAATEAAKPASETKRSAPPLAWRTVEIVAEVGTEFGVLHDGNGVLQVCTRRQGEQWPHGHVPSSGFNRIEPGHTMYCVLDDGKGHATMPPQAVASSPHEDGTQDACERGVGDAPGRTVPPFAIRVKRASDSDRNGYTDRWVMAFTSETPCKDAELTCEVSNAVKFPTAQDAWDGIGRMNQAMQSDLEVTDSLGRVVLRPGVATAPKSLYRVVIAKDLIRMAEKVNNLTRRFGWSPVGSMAIGFDGDGAPIAAQALSRPCFGPDDKRPE